MLEVHFNHIINYKSWASQTTYDIELEQCLEYTILQKNIYENTILSKISILNVLFYNKFCILYLVYLFWYILNT